MSLLSHRHRIALAIVATAGLAACQRHAGQPRAATLAIRITDGAGGPLVAARVELFDGDRLIEMGRRELYGGARQGEGACELAHGALGTANGLLVAYGEATIPVGGGDACTPSPALPLGRYHVRVWRGFEYEVWEGDVTIARGQEARLDVALVRAWSPEIALAADLHVHAGPSTDSPVPPAWRVMAQACAGIQVTALSNHASNGDLDDAIAQLGLARTITSIASNEGSSELAHVGVYPATVARGAPRGGSPDEPTMAKWSREQILGWARAQPGAIVQINHPRFRMYALFDGARWDGVRWPPPFPTDFDAVEVLNGHNAFNAPGDRRIDEVVRDFYTLTDHGVALAAVGGSDTHHLNGVLDGVARTYVIVGADAAARLDEAAVIAAIRAHRTIATTGPFLSVFVHDAQLDGGEGPGGTVQTAIAKVGIDVTLRQASWVHADTIRIRVNGEIIRTEHVAPDEREHRVAFFYDRPPPYWIGVEAEGSAPLPAWMTGTYQQEKGRPGVTPYAIISPIRVEARP